jgi:hypothetical protein
MKSRFGCTPNAFVMFPLNRFLSNRTLFSCEQFRKHSGNGPVKLLLFTVNSRRAYMLHNSGHNSAKKLLLEKLTLLRKLYFPKSLGTVPEKLLVKREIYVKLVRREMVFGNSP